MAGYVHELPAGTRLGLPGLLPRVLQLLLDRLSLVGPLEPLLEIGDRRLRVAGAVQGGAQVEERVRVLDVLAAGRVRVHGPPEERDRLGVTAGPHQLEALGVQVGTARRGGLLGRRRLWSGRGDSLP